MIDPEKLNKYFRGDSSQQEKEEIQLWIEEDEKNKTEFMSLRTLFDITLGSLPETPMQKSNPALKKGRSLVYEWMKIAAAVVITFMVSYFYMNNTRQNQAVEMQTLHVPAGQRAELTLADGTKVWLNALTTLTFPNRFTDSSRKVYLDGEAYFDVKHDKQRLFTVNTQKYDINVLGTEFNVTAYNKNGLFETALLNGAVEIESSNGQQKLRLNPGERAYTENENLLVTPIQDYDTFLWREGIISLKNERIENILKKLELYYDVEIINKKNSIKDIPYTGKFRTKDGVEHILNVLKIPTKLTYTKDNDKNQITIN